MHDRAGLHSDSPMTTTTSSCGSEGHQDTLLTSLPSHVIPQRFDEFGYGMLVANGMGVNGEAASRIAVTTLVHLVVYFGKWHLRIEEPIAGK